MKLRWWRSRVEKWNRDGGLFRTGYDAQTDLGMSSGGQAMGSGAVTGGDAGMVVQRPPDPGYDVHRDVGF